MDRALRDTVTHYPHLQGLRSIPLGVVVVVAGVSNLEAAPTGPALLGLLGGGLLLAGAVEVFITRYYRNTYGRTTPTTAQRVRLGAALAAWVLVLFVAGNSALWSPSPSISLFTSAFALATLVFHAVLVGIRAHHIVIWGGLLVAGLIPMWGGLGADRDAIAMFPLGAGLVVSGLLDQRLLAQALGGHRPTVQRADV